ncbi:MAG: hypothetical protein QM500_09155 [Methylococcales bacterium]
MIKIFLITIIFLPFHIDANADDIKLTTWNIEHLGTSGRGFGGGFGGGSIPLRNDKQLKDIGEFIRDDLKSDIVALQEISIDYIEDGESRSEQLDIVIKEMGSDYRYYIPPQHEDHDDESMYVGFLWNSSKVNAAKVAPLDVPNLKLAGKSLFDRTPVIGYFEIKTVNGSANDFVAVNVHLASGQHNDENHLIAMTMIEYRLNKALKSLQIKESDRIILGDFNDNPYAKSPTDKNIHTDALYHHMKFKGYSDFVTDDFHSTRMDNKLRSVIDHILVNKGAKKDIDEMKAEIYLPPSGKSGFAQWRKTYSDHFPISIYINTLTKDNDVDWK